MKHTLFLKTVVLGAAILSLSAVSPFAAAHQGDGDHAEYVVPHLLVHAASHNKFQEVKRLLDSGVDPDMANKIGGTGLIWAANKSHVGFARMLLKYGANPNHTDNWNFTPLMVAAKKGHVGLATLLLNYGADPDWIEKDGIFAQTALMVAASQGHTEMVKILLNGGADPNYAGSDGVTALIMAAVNGHAEAAALISAAEKFPEKDKSLIRRFADWWDSFTP